MVNGGHYQQSLAQSIQSMKLLKIVKASAGNQRELNAIKVKELLFLEKYMYSLIKSLNENEGGNEDGNEDSSTIAKYEEMKSLIES